MIVDLYILLDLVLISLATWRLSYMLVSEDGNMSIAYAIRLLGMRPRNGERSRWSAWKQSLTKPAAIVPLDVSNNFGKMLTCIWCTTVFIGILYVIAYLYFGTTLIFTIVTLSLDVAALAVIINDFKFSQ